MYLFIDTETTGINKARDRVVQLAWVVVDKNRLAESIKNYIIRPDGFFIPASATAIHGISTAQAEVNGSNLADVLKDLISDAKNVTCFIAHNASFDLAFLRREFHEAGLTYPFGNSFVVCTMQISTSFCRLPKQNGTSGYKYPTLQELHFHLFKSYFDDAHNALADTQACMKCFFELMRLGVLGPSITTNATRSSKKDLAFSEKTSGNKEEPYIARSSVLQKANQEINFLKLELDKLGRELAKLREELAKEKESSQQLVDQINYYESDENGIFDLVVYSNDRIWKIAAASHPGCPEEELSYLYETSLNDEEIIRELAQNPSLSAEYLTEIVESWGEQLQKIVATNPSATPGLLAEIVWLSEFKILASVEKNPSFKLEALEALLQKKAGSEDEKVRSCVAEYSGCPQYLLKALAFDSSKIVRKAVMDNPNKPPGLQVDIFLKKSCPFCGGKVSEISRTCQKCSIGFPLDW